jgi:hypothetical protein
MMRAFADVFGGVGKPSGYTPSPENQDPVFKALSGLFGFVNQAGQNRINEVSKDLKVPKPIQETEANTSGIDKKAGEQIKETQKTNLAIKDLATKITSQTSLQTSVAAIYNLLASGMLRVQTNVKALIAPGAGNPRGFEDSDLPFPPGTKPEALFTDPNAWKAQTFPSVSSDIQTVSVIEPPRTVASTSGSYREVSINAPITINGTNQDANQIATLVVRKLGEAVNDAESASLFNTYVT